MLSPRRSGACRTAATGTRTLRWQACPSSPTCAAGIGGGSRATCTAASGLAGVDTLACAAASGFGEDKAAACTAAMANSAACATTFSARAVARRLSLAGHGDNEEEKVELGSYSTSIQ